MQLIAIFLSLIIDKLHSILYNERVVSKNLNLKLEIDMNTDYRVELFQEDIMQTVAVLFDRPADPHNITRSHGKPYTYKAPSDMALKVGDQVIVEVSSEFKVVTVVEVHETPNIDYSNSSIHYKWLVGKVDMASYNKCLESDKLIRHKLRLLAHNRQRHSLIDQLKAEFGESAVEDMKPKNLNTPNFRKTKTLSTPPDEDETVL